MRHRRGDIWSVVPDLGPQDILCITTNSTVTARGKLVMGRGIALQARDRFPGLDVLAGSRIRMHPTTPAYLLTAIRPGEVPGLDFNMGLFQVKHGFREAATLELIKGAAEMLAGALTPPAPVVGGKTLQLRTICSGGHAHLTFPGIGAGQLRKEDVLPVIAPILGDNVTVWELG